MNFDELTHPDFRDVQSHHELRVRLVEYQRALMARSGWPPVLAAGVQGTVMCDGGDVYPIIRCDSVLPCSAARLFELVAVQTPTTLVSWNEYVYACNEVERLPGSGRVLVDYNGVKGISTREDVFLQCLFRDENGRFFELSTGVEHPTIPRQNRYVRSSLYFCSKMVTPLGPDRARYTVYWQYDVSGWLARIIPASIMARLAMANLKHEFALLAGPRIAGLVEALRPLPASAYDLFSFEQPGRAVAP